MGFRTFIYLLIYLISVHGGQALANEQIPAESKIDPRSKTQYSTISKIDKIANPPQKIEAGKVWQALDNAMQDYLQDMHYCGHQRHQRYNSELLGKGWIIYASSHINPRMRRLCKVSVHTLHEASEISADDLYAKKYLGDYDLDYYMDLNNEEIIGKMRDSQLGFIEVLEKYSTDGFRAKIQIDSECLSEDEKLDGQEWTANKHKHEELSRKLEEHMIDVIVAGKEEPVPMPEDKYSVSSYYQDQEVSEIELDQTMQARLIYPAEANKRVQFEIGPYQWFDQNYIPHEENSSQVIKYSEEDFSYINSFYGASHFVKANPCSSSFKNLRQELDTLLPD